MSPSGLAGHHWAREEAVEKTTLTLKAWTGPCAVKEVAAGLRELGVTVTIEGTEHVYVSVVRDTEAQACHALRWVLRSTKYHWLEFRAAC